MGKQRRLSGRNEVIPGLERALCAILKEHRQAKGVSQQELSYRTGLDRSFLSLIETGARRPSITTLFLIAHFLGVAPSQLIRELENRIDVSTIAPK